MYRVSPKQMELVIKSNCVICESKCQLIHQMDRFTKDNPSMFIGVVPKVTPDGSKIYGDTVWSTTGACEYYLGRH